MKLLRKVKSIEVKRCFVISDFIRHHRYNTEAMGAMSRQTYLRQLEDAKKTVTKIPEALLDLMIKGTTPKRFEIYQKLKWYIAEVNTDEVRVWKGAGGLPQKWTGGSLFKTGNYVREALDKNLRSVGKRARSAIPGIIKTSLPYLQKEKYLLPIAIPYRSLDKTFSTIRAGDIDDGCMRSIALAVSGRKKLRLYIGKKK